MGHRQKRVDLSPAAEGDSGEHRKGEQEGSEATEKASKEVSRSTTGAKEKSSILRRRQSLANLQLPPVHRSRYHRSTRLRSCVDHEISTFRESGTWSASVAAESVGARRQEEEEKAAVQG